MSCIALEQEKKVSLQDMDMLMDVQTNHVVKNRIEVVSDATALRFIRSLQFFFVLAFALLVVESVWVQAGSDDADHGTNLLYLNLSIGIVSYVVVGIAGYVAYKDVMVLCSSKVVVPKQVSTFFKLSVVDFLLRLVMLFLFMGLDIYLLVEECAWVYSSAEILAFMKWSLFNASVSNQFLIILSMLPRQTIESALCTLKLHDYLVNKRNVRITRGSDLPRSAYACVFFSFFSVTEICLLISLLASTGAIGGTWCSQSNIEYCLSAMNTTSCNPWAAGCSSKKGYGRQTMSIAGSVITVFNMLLYIAGIYYTNKNLLPLPYKEYKALHLQVGYQILTRMSFTVLAILNYIMFVLVGYASCPVSFVTTVGFAPLAFALTICISMSLWMQTPRICSVADADDQIYWGPSAEHVESVTCSYPHILKGFIFSYIVYDIEELPEEERMFCVEEYLEEYKLSNHVVIWNKKIDSKCLMAWNEKTGDILMAFRGTASGRNVLSDLKIWRENHPPVRGNYFLGTRPLVHAGFREFFYDSGTKKSCFDIIKGLLDSGENDARQWRIFTCGHSLGAAASKLAAYETSSWLDSHYPNVKYSLKCYCYGSPRVGNSAFVKSYNQQCPDTWNIMHLDDIVTRGGKFISMYKREGRSLFLADSGNILKPSYIERVTLRGIKASIQQHLMPSYGCSIIDMVKHEDWDSPVLQRIHFAITNSRAYRDISIKFSLRLTITASAISDLSHDVDLATGLSSDLVNRKRLPSVQKTPPGRVFVSVKSALHNFFS